MLKTLSKFLVHKNRQKLLLDPEFRLLMGLLSNEGSRKGHRTVLQSRTCVIVKQSPNRTIRREYTLSKETSVGQKEVRRSSQEENPDDEVNAKYEDVANKACDAKKHNESPHVSPGNNKCGKKLRDANRRLAELEKTIERDIQELRQKHHLIMQTMSKSNTKRKKATNEKGNKGNEELKNLKGIRKYKDKHQIEENIAASSQKNLVHEEDKNGDLEFKDNDIKKGDAPDFLKYLVSYPFSYGGNDQVVNLCGCDCCNQYYLYKPYASVTSPAPVSPGSMCIQEDYCYRNYHPCAKDHSVRGHVWNCCCSSKKINQISQSFRRCSTDLQTEHFYRRTSSRSPSPVQGKNIKHIANTHSQGECNIGGQQVNKRTQKGDNASPQSLRTPSKSPSPDRNMGVKYQKDFQNKIKSHRETRSNETNEGKRAKENEMLVKDKPRKGESENVLSGKERKSRESNFNGVKLTQDSVAILRNRSSRKTYSPILVAGTVQSTSKQRDKNDTLRTRKTLADFSNSPREHMQNTFNEAFNAPSTSNGSPILHAGAAQSTSKQRDKDGTLRTRKTLADFCNSPRELMQNTFNETFNAPSTSNGSPILDAGAAQSTSKQRDKNDTLRTRKTLADFSNSPRELMQNTFNETFNAPSTSNGSPIVVGGVVQSTSKRRDKNDTLRTRRTLSDFCNSPRELMQNTFNESFNAPSTSNGSGKYSRETMRELKKMKIREYTALPPNDNNLAKSDGSKLKQRTESQQMSEEKAKRYQEYIRRYKNQQQNHDGIVGTENANRQRHVQSAHDDTEEELYAYGPNSEGWDAYDENGECVNVEEYKQKVKDLLGIEDDTGGQANKLNIKSQARSDNAKLRSLSTERSAKAHSTATRSRMTDRPENPKSDFKQDKEQTNKSKQFYSNNSSPLCNDHQKYKTFKDPKVEVSKANQSVGGQYDIYANSDATQSPRSARSKRNNSEVASSRTYSNLKDSDKNRIHSVSKEIKSGTTYVLTSCSQDTPNEETEHMMAKRKKESLQKPQSHSDTKPKPMTYTNTKEKAREHSTKQNHGSNANKAYPRNNKPSSSYKTIESKTRENNRFESNSPQIKTVTENDESSSIATTVKFLGNLLKCYRKGLLEDEHLKALAEELYANFSTHSKCNGSSRPSQDKATYVCQDKRTIESQCYKQEKSEQCQTENESKISEPMGSDAFHKQQFPNRFLENANNITDAEIWSNEQLISETRNSNYKENDLTTGSLVAKPNSAATSQFKTEAPQTLNGIAKTYLQEEVTSNPKQSQSFEDSTGPYKLHVTTTGSEVSLNAAYKAPLTMEHKNQQFVSKDNFQQQPVDPNHTELPKYAEFLKEEFPTHSSAINYNLKENRETLSASNDNNLKLDIDSHERNTSKNACSTVLIPLNVRSSNYECRYEIVDDNTNTGASKGILISCCPCDVNEESPNISRELLGDSEVNETIQTYKFEIDDQYFDDECGVSFDEEYQDIANVTNGNYDKELDSEDENSTWPANNHVPLQDTNINLPLKSGPTFRNCPCMFETYVNMMKIYNRHRQSPRFAES